jgi:hypothetical protein
MTQVKFTEVAHLYLGCDMQHRWSARDENCTRKLTADNLKFGTTDWVPMLIPIENLTDQIKNEIADINFNTVIGKQLAYSDLLKVQAEITIKLLAKGYDLFNLIANGEAIRKEVSNG